MITSDQIQYIRKAYELGKRHAATGDYTSWYTPRLQMAYDLGYEGVGVDFDHIVKGYRFGDVPEGCSFNFRDNCKEHGVSLAAIEGQKEVGSVMWFGDRKKVEVTGLLISDTGSDGEPLVIPLDMEEQYDY